MKKIVLCFSIIVSIILIVLFIVISNRKIDLKIVSYDLESSFSLGKYKLELLEEEDNKSKYRIINNSLDEIDLKNDFLISVFNTETINYYIYNFDGYYYYVYINDNEIVIGNMCENYYNYVYPVFIIPSNDRLISGTSVKNSKYYNYYNENMFYDKFNECFINPFNENELLDFYNKMNNNICRVDYDNKKVYLKVFSKNNSTLSDGFDVEIIVTETGFEVYGKM